MTNEITTRTSVYFVRPDGIIVQRNLPGASTTLEDARENIAAFNQLAGERRRLLLVDTRELVAHAPGVRELYAGEEAMRWTAALALVTKTSGPGRVLANLYLTFASPRAPTRIFADEVPAVDWLHKIGGVFAGSRGREL